MAEECVRIGDREGVGFASVGAESEGDVSGHVAAGKERRRIRIDLYIHVYINIELCKL